MNWREAMNEKGWDFDGDRPSSFQVVYFRDINASLDHHDFVEGLLCSGAMSVWYGASGCGKTHEAGDLGMHLALGWPWRGREVERGGVLYIAAEGGAGMLNRVAAFRRYHNVQDEDIPFAVIPSTVNLRDGKVD